MRFRVKHRTGYRYSRPVFLEPHTFRFCPRTGGGQRLVSFAIEVEPRPALISECLDAEGNAATEAWFDELTDHLQVSASFEAETSRPDPYDFLLDDPAAGTLPVTYNGDLAEGLAAYRNADNVAAEVREFAERVAGDVGRDTLLFLPEICSRVAELCVYEIRHEGPPQPAGVTLERSRGACRDVAVLYIEACRSLGLAARFVSGYQHGSEEEESREMHAWAEVYLPGGGWRGFDSSHGLAVGDQLVAVAASAQPALASPVTGSIRGTGATQTMEFEIEVS